MRQFLIHAGWIKSRFFWYGIFIVLLAAGGFLIVAQAQPYSYHGTVINPPKPAPNFTLTDVQGQTFQLSSQKGRVVLLFFGYTNCPDECPTTLAIVKQAISSLGNKANQVEFVFITVDPDRDTATVLQSYLQKYDPTFIGLTGSSVGLQPVWSNYGVYVTKNAGSTSTSYTLTHSTNLYVINQQGYLSIVYSYGTPPGDISNDLLHLLP